MENTTAKHHLKAKSRGSWTNVLSFPSDRSGLVKDACEHLLQAAGGTVSFKITDDTGTTLAALDARFEPVGWSDR